MNIVIHPFPAPGDNNMFLKLFYRQVDGHTIDGVQYHVVPLSLPQILAAVHKDRTTRRVIHLHWEAVMYGSHFVLKSLGLMLFRFSILAILKKVYGVKICWTVHNNTSHDYPHPFIDRIGRNIIFTLADGIVLQQTAVFTAWHQAHARKNIVYIPLGNYMGGYSSSGRSRTEVRQDFGLKGDDLVLLSFGIVKPYKKIDEIIKAFRQLPVGTDPRLKLCIAGTATVPYAAYLNRLIAGDSRIIFRNVFVPDAAMADILAMADYAVFWYDDSMLTSGGLALALSYGLPAITRNIPASERIIDGQNGFLFDDAKQLTAIFQKIPVTTPPSRERVIQSISADSWEVQALSYVKLYRDLLS